MGGLDSEILKNGLLEGVDVGEDCQIEGVDVGENCQIEGVDVGEDCRTTKKYLYLLFLPLLFYFLVLLNLMLLI